MENAEEQGPAVSQDVARQSRELCVVVPVYNEEGSIGQVLEKWAAAFESQKIDYEIRAYNDGSTDNSLTVMRKAADKLGRRMIIRDKANGGHGQTILTGYREAAADGFKWVFQVDSDDEMEPDGFAGLWTRREGYDFLAGIRKGRSQPFARRVVSAASRFIVQSLYGRGIWDVNVPYRLMRVSAFGKFFQAIPPDTFAPNVILAGLAARHRLRCYETTVAQHNRRNGEVRLRSLTLLKAAAKSFWQTIMFRLR